MKTELMNEMELEQVNGTGLLNWLIPNFPTDSDNHKEAPKYTLPGIDEDNRPAIDTLEGPVFSQK